MIPRLDDPTNVFYTIDVETGGELLSRGGKDLPGFFEAASEKPGVFTSSPYYHLHSNSALLQLEAMRNNEFVSGMGYIRQTKGGVSPFAIKKRIWAKARVHGAVSEEDAIRNLFVDIEKQIAAGKKVTLGGWNVLYDISHIETITWRYSSLAKYRGLLKKYYHSGKLVAQEMEEPFIKLAMMFGEQKGNEEWARKMFQMSHTRTPITETTWPGKIATTYEQMKFTEGWSVNRVYNAIVGSRAEQKAKIEEAVLGVGFHDAQKDIITENFIYDTFESAFQLTGFGQRSTDVADDIRSALATAFSIPLGPEAEIDDAIKTHLSSVFRAGREVKPAITEGSHIPGVAIAGIVAATLLLVLSNTRRNQPYGQITGLADTGMAAEGRHRDTDFGSGYQGLDDSPTLRSAGYSVATATGAFLVHRHMLSTRPTYGKNLYNLFDTIEQKSPGRILKTFGLADWFSAYLPDELAFGQESLIVKDTGKFTELGAHVNRITGITAETMSGGLTLKRPMKDGVFVTGTPYLDVVEAPGVSIRVARRGRTVSSAALYGSTLTEGQPMPRPKGTGVKNFIDALRDTQKPKNIQGFGKTLEGEAFTYAGKELKLQPLLAKVEGQEVKSFLDTAKRLAFNLAERPQRNLFQSVGFGLRIGTYNKIVHIPFVGEGGLVNEYLTKRVLPAYLAYTGLKYVDYKLGHKPSRFIASIPAKANLLRAHLTDTVPGARDLTDLYADTVPGPQYGPLALPAGGAILGAMWHWSDSLKNKFLTEAAKKATLPKYMWAGAAVGALLALPFVPGMIGSRKTEDELQRVYSGEEEVPIRAGRWWEVGSTPYAGSRIKYFRPHWFATMQAKAEDVSLYGSEKEAWAHNPLLHPIRAFTDPYYLERENYETRPYPITSPAFSNVPLVGPLLAATIGKLVKPPVLMHEGEWSPDKYTLYSPRLEPGPDGLPPQKAVPEYGAGDVARRQAQIAMEFIGLPGFLMQSAQNRATRNSGPDQVLLEGSRQMTNVSREYYERELGALVGTTTEGGMYGFSEPIRRFIQPEKLQAQVNEIPNQMPSWLPGEDYFTNFKVGDAYARIPEGDIRLPGAGYESIHPELQGIDPEEYPNITKMKILSDVAPYSSEYEHMRSRVYEQTADDTNLRIEYDRIVDRVEQIKKSSIQFNTRRFTEDTERVQGTVKSVSRSGVELEQYPGRVFKLSSLGISAADVSARVLGENNNLTRSQLVAEVESRQHRLLDFMYDYMEPGSTVTAVIPKGAVEHSTEISSVLVSGGVNINRALVDQGLAELQPDTGGPESKELYGSFGKAIGALGEAMSFVGDRNRFNPMRYIPTPMHTKLWQEQTAISRYEEEEVYGTRMRRWDRPLHDFIAPYLRGVIHRLTDDSVTTAEVMLKHDMNSMVDIMKYMRAISSGDRFRASRTAIGADLFGAPSYVKSTLPHREQLYFDEFLKETDPKKRTNILAQVPAETARALEAQWVAQDAIIATAEGKKVPPIDDQGRLVTKEALNAYKQAKTSLGFGDYQRSEEIAHFFDRTGLTMPEPGSEAYDPQIDYEDVKVKMLMQEGYDLHDFNIYDDRANMVWRKPYLDGAIRELTSGGNKTVEDTRRAVEEIMLAHDVDSKVVATGHRTDNPYSTVNITYHEKPEERILRDMRQNPEDYD